MSSISENTVSVIGVGKLGLCFALLLENSGYTVHAVDKNKSYIKELSQGTFKSSEPYVSQLLRTQNKIAWYSSLILDAVKDSSIIFILADTPYKSPEVPYDCCNIDSVIFELNNLGIKGKHFVINSTVFPGYCQSKIKSIPNNYLAYSPEFIAQGNIINGLSRPDLVLIGSENKKTITEVSDVYERLCTNKPQICSMSLIESEITKLSVNTFLTTKISYTNYISDLADSVGADPGIILKAVGCDTRIGHKYLKPGFGYGGPCLVRDNIALGKFADKMSIPSVIGKANDYYNSFHTKYQVDKYLKLDAKPYAFKGSVTYKPDTVLLENSQQLIIAETLLKAGKNICIEDDEEVIDKLKNMSIFIEHENQIKYVPINLL